MVLLKRNELSNNLHETSQFESLALLLETCSQLSLAEAPIHVALELLAPRKLNKENPIIASPVQVRQPSRRIPLQPSAPFGASPSCNVCDDWLAGKRHEAKSLDVFTRQSFSSQSQSLGPLAALRGVETESLSRCTISKSQCRIRLPNMRPLGSAN